VIKILLIEMMINDIEVNGVTQKQYANLAKVSEPTINRFINQKIVLGFDSVLNIVKHKFPDREKQIMRDYIVLQENQNARLSLEYCMINKMPEIADQIIYKLKNSEYPVNKEWAKIYEIERMRNKKEITPLEVNERVHIVEAKSEEMKVMSKLLQIYANYDLANYPYLQGLVVGLEQRIDAIKSSSMKSSFKLRLGQILSYMSLYNNEVDACRYYANMVIENTDSPYFRATGYHIMGRSFLYDSYEEGLKSFKQALYYYKQIEQEKLQEAILRNIKFLDSFWNKVSEYVIDFDNNHYINDLAYYEVKAGNKDKAIQINGKVDLEQLNNWEKGFYYYYKAVIYDDNVDLYYDSVRYFRKSGDKFYIKLPLIELKRLGERDSILKAFLE
jgi:predicted XRE-type DNA-binding protein